MICRTAVDFWAFRARSRGVAGLQETLQEVFAGGAEGITLAARSKGWNAFSEAADVRLGKMNVGMVAAGGESQRGWAYVGITGRGCQWIRDWDRAQEVAGRCEGYELKRVDLAYDVVNRSAFEDVIAAHRAGAFTTKGRPPSMRKIDTESEADGRTIYVGSRSESKLYRGYEKGKELLGPELERARDEESFDVIEFLSRRWLRTNDDGKEVLSTMWDWWRHELELKSTKGPLPVDLIDRRDEFFSGAYPYLGEVLQGVEPQILQMPRERGPQIDLVLALSQVRRQYGATLFTALAAHHGDIGAVWDRVVGHKHSEALLRAGVLSVEHD